MRDDLAAINIGKAEDDYKREFFWRSYRDIEMFLTRILSKGPVEVSSLVADDVTVSGNLTLGGNLVTDFSGANLEAGSIEVIGDISVGDDATITGDLDVDGVITGNLTGNVTGNLNGGVTGPVTGNVTGNLTGSASITGTLTPNVTGTINLGSASLRWATVYTSDLSLSNGVGDWTIVEGEDDLFLYNNKKNRTYRFALVEVHPSIVPPKKV